MPIDLNLRVDEYRYRQTSSDQVDLAGADVFIHKNLTAILVNQYLSRLFTAKSIIPSAIICSCGADIHLSPVMAEALNPNGPNPENDQSPSDNNTSVELIFTPAPMGQWLPYNLARGFNGNGRRARWLMEISTYNVEVLYKERYGNGGNRD